MIVICIATFSFQDMLKSEHRVEGTPFSVAEIAKFAWLSILGETLKLGAQRMIQLVIVYYCGCIFT